MCGNVTIINLDSQVQVFIQDIASIFSFVLSHSLSAHVVAREILSPKGGLSREGLYHKWPEFENLDGACAQMESLEKQ